jgi:capsid protein
VDVGRNSAAVLQELSSGIRTFESVCGEMGEDWRQVLEEKAREAAYIKALSNKYDIDPSQISTAIVDRPERIQTDKPMSANPPPAQTTEPVPA